ncbi:MAG: aminotransferase class I/II-fold pyridoxal phosphate-dependent enzyme, partial [Clostridia bacterium]|nr:aminotransferase class I/II-fold pyridoxal phosphate-dependent enzyme [Clostridia bacterium]
QKEVVQKKYNELKELRLKLDMSRGKPSSAQLELSNGMLDVLCRDDVANAMQGDLRNYGILDGINECKEMMAQMLETKPENVIVFGNSTLNIMYDTVSKAVTHGILGNTPWGKLDKVKFLCPVPGYDRHFAITESFGIEMINVPMTSEGPDMDVVEELVKDESVKGMWCVPKYSNPMGISFSDAVIKRIANLKCAAKDFRLFWDNAYCEHHIYENDQDEILNILDECEKAGNTDMPYVFTSTSKITWPGSGVAAMASSKANIDSIKKLISFQTIGHDKINQMRHVKFFGSYQGIKDIMMKHAELLRPKFDVVAKSLKESLDGLGIAEWTEPKGGYFVSFNTLEGCAKRTVALCKEAGVVMTGAGATYPYGKDPKDSNIRIAPSLPPVEELQKACEVFVTSVKLASLEKLCKM